MMLPTSAYTSRPWRMHDIAPDFAVEDVWALPTVGGAGELPRLVNAIFASNFPDQAPRLVRLLWEARWKLGAILGWDDHAHGFEGADGLGGRVSSLRDRLPVGMRAASSDPEPDLAPFSPIYQFDDEFAAELANATVHTAMHLGWVPDGTGSYHGQMTVLVKPNGPLGSLYLAGISPLRRYIVYPALLRQIGRQWSTAAPAH